MARLFSYLNPMRGRLAFSISTSVTNKVLDLAPPILVAWLIDTVTRQPPEWLSSVPFVGENLVHGVVFFGIAAVVIFGLESLFQYFYDFGFKTLAQRLQHMLRLDAYTAMQRREMRFFEEQRLGKTLAMLNDDVNQLERFLNTGFNDLVQLGVLFIFAGAVLFGVSWELALLGLIPVPIIIGGSYWFSKLLEPRYARVRETVGEVASRLENNIGGILVIKSFTAEKYEAKRVEQVSEEYRVANEAAIKLNSAFIPIIRMAIALGFAVVVGLGGYWALQGHISAGSLVLFSMMIQRILWPLTRLGQTMDEFQRAKASARRIFGLLDTPEGIKDPETPRELKRARGELAFRDVYFHYREDTPILKGLDFMVEAGETIGFAGATGAGKSTLIKLLLRLYDVQGGHVCLDGHDVREYRQADLRRNIALVSQDIYLFHGTIGENISYPQEDVDSDRIVRAAQLAEFDDFVQSLPGGYDTIVGERGIKLSGGQRQRLSLARAIMKDAPVLILDEATSSVDTETERLIQRNLEKLTAGRTALVIAHRLSTIRNADRILVIGDGQLIEQGKHDDLIETGGVYSDLWSVQSGAPTPISS